MNWSLIDFATIYEENACTHLAINLEMYQEVHLTPSFFPIFSEIFLKLYLDNLKGFTS